MTDRVGTVRKSPDGVVAVCTGSYMGWLASVPEGSGRWWRSESELAAWEVVYEPPVIHPVGTVLRREGVLAYGTTTFWEVATLTEQGWVVTTNNDRSASGSDEQPYDDEEGAWEVIHEV